MADVPDIAAVQIDQQEPITDIGVLASKKEIPDDYWVVGQTTDGFDANLWKDSIFKSKVTRYLCFTRAATSRNPKLSNVVVDMKLLELKDSLPEGFTPIQDTMDTQEQALRKERLCVKFVPRHSTDMAICNVAIQSKSKLSLPYHTYIGELNGLAIWYQLKNVPKPQEMVQKSTSVSDVTRCMQ
ncbi:hypothetical protein DNTS_023671 [Danionella cerebrum]|uniref:MABP domain-containing protein n=1 Tax=Danionella cerebrum TaxID=2873325 RepID=A0A553MMH3_9TELE|nr:hypothetical protein DNTS_023671 [Danionella translucida]